MSEQQQQQQSTAVASSELDNQQQLEQLKQSNELWRTKSYKLEDANKLLSQQLKTLQDEHTELVNYTTQLEDTAGNIAELRIEQIDTIKAYINKLEFKITPDDIRHLYDMLRFQDTLYKGPEHAITFKVNSENMELYELK